MAEYIDREALYEKAYWHGEHPDVGNPFPDGVDAIDIKDVDAIPAADVAPVVRCKDCRYRGSICCPAVHETMGNGLVDYAVDNGYCWCGKPKET